ncbi:hypothetical protein PybrP1_011245 [[Pythium] brassicae (nom. inval.)]|nr:hypothetical protein PybrP1_011245 [[Pythium] brassicae (nom. inval.)]
MEAPPSSSFAQDGASSGGATAPPKRARLNFTLKQRQRIWQHSQAHPKLKQQELARWAKEAFCMDAEPSQSAISYALRRHKQYEALGDAEGDMKRPRNVKHPKLDAALAKWVRECYDSGTRISSLMVKQKAVTFCERLNIPKSARPSFSNGWLHAFNKRYGFRNYARHREVMSDDQSVLAASSAIPRKPRGPYSTVFKREVVRYYNDSGRNMQATLHEFFSADKTAAVLDKKRKFVVSWAREEERMVMAWLLDANRSGVPVSMPLLERKAQATAAEFGLLFLPTWHWRQDFLKRFTAYSHGSGYMPPASLYGGHRLLHDGGAMSEEHKQQQEHGGYGGWRAVADSGSGPYGAPPGSHQALLLNMRGGPAQATSRFSVYQEQRGSGELGRAALEAQYFSGQTGPPQFQPQPFLHQPHAQFDPSVHHHQQHPLHPHVSHQAAPVASVPSHVAVTQAPQTAPPVAAPLQQPQAMSAVPTVTASPPPPRSEEVASHAVKESAPPQKYTQEQDGNGGDEGEDEERREQAARDEENGPTGADSQPKVSPGAKAIRDLGDKVVEARKVEMKLRVEGLRYDNEVKRIKIVEENMLARKRLKDAGVPDAEVDRLMPAIQF